MTKRRTKWTDDKVREELLSSIEVLMLDRMPTASELQSIGRNDLHCIVGRTKKYSGWAEDLGLKLSSNATRTGNKYEKVVKELLESKGFKVESMTTKHPYDLKVNENVKVDVKVANLYTLAKGTSWWTFHLAKEHATCDIYICVALGAEDFEKRVFIIPSHFLQMKSLNIGKSTKYSKFVSQFQIISEYSDFMKSISSKYF